MTGLHPLLRRQLARFRGDGSVWSAPDFLRAVDAAYHQSDIDRALLERSLELSSQELLQVNADVRAIIEAFPDVFLWFDADGRVLGCRSQDSAEPLLSGGIVDHHARDISDGDVAAKFSAALARIAEGAPSVTVEYSLTRESELRHYEARFVPAHERQTLAIVRDITERRRAEQSLRERDEQLRQAQRMEAVGLLAGGVAHDFNNVLTAIAGYTALLLDQMDAADPMRRDVEQIQRAGESAAALTHQLLAFSRRQLLRPTVLDLNDVVARTETLLRPLIGEHITVRSHLCSDLWRVEADPGQIEQIITNLVVNARDAMPAGGHLVLETANVDLPGDRPAAPDGLPAGRYVRLIVSDTGCGIPPEIQSRVFEPFFTTKRRGEGTGLGLSTVYGIVKQSGGSVRIKSAPGRGTALIIDLPAVESPAERAAPRDASAPAGSETILIAEDQTEVRSVIRSTLASRGYVVLEAADGMQALDLIRHYESPIHLIVTDIVMPGLSGWVLADHLRLLKPDARVLFVSGYTDDEIVRQGVIRSSVEFLHKPFTPYSLLRKVRTVLDKPQARPDETSLPHRP